MIQSNGNRIVGLVAKNTTTYVEKALSCMSNGDIVVPLSSKDDTYRIDVAHVDEVQQVEEKYGWMKPELTLRDDDTVAQILFTSGTEGEPKGVVLTHRALSDVVKRLNSVMQVSADIREYIGVPVYHSFGFGRCRAVAAAGGHAYIPAQGFNPVEINQLLEAREINAISAVPSLWRILLDSNAITKTSGERVRWIEIGSQYMSRDEKQAMKALFPNAKIIQHYGLTEASRSTFLEIHTAPDDRLESVGRGYGGVEVALAEDGRIKIRGPHVTHMLIQSGKHFDPRDNNGWLTTNDLGEMDGDYLYYKGRSDDVINCGGLKLPPDALEAGMRRTLNRQGDFAVCRVPDAMRGDGILVAAASTLEATDAELTDAAVNAAAIFNVNASGATRIYRIDALPRTATGKIQRKEIARQYLLEHPLDNETETNRVHVTKEGRKKKSLREEFCGILGVTEIEDDKNFTDSGGDSLGFIQASMAIQQYLGYLPRAWENMPIAQLEALPRRTARWVTMEASAIVRALAIFAIVVNHANIFNQIGVDISGSAFMLVIPMGYVFARFQLQRVLKTEDAVHALSALPRIMIPAFLLVLAHELKGGALYPSVLLFFNNLVDPNLDRGYSFWFLNIFVQLTVIYFLLLAIPRFRQAMRNSPYIVSLNLFVIGYIVSQIIPHYIWNTDHLYNLVPWRFFCYFALGWCLYYGHETKYRVINTILILFLGLMQAPEMRPESTWFQTSWVLLGGLILAWIPSIRLPRVGAAVVTAVASASLYIYLINWTVLDVLMKLPVPYIFYTRVLVTILVGIAFHWAFDFAWNRVIRLLPSNRKCYAS